MLSVIFTWIGAMLGLVVLIAMALGAFVVDFDDALGRRAAKAEAREVPLSPDTV